MKIKTKKIVIEALRQEYADARTLLNFNNVFELLVAVVLSAQCTDERVNIITARLFPKLGNPEALAAVSVENLESQIREAGLYKAKAKNLISTAKIILNDYNGIVPSDFEQLIALPGVGQKTANVILSVGYNIPALAVDTHVFRVANRTGLAVASTPEIVEERLKKIISKSDWSKAHHWLIWHGRRVCKARKPLCGKCLIVDYCDFIIKGMKK
ncbi:MAG: endonuclease III [Negativicutes bacterium]